MPAECRQKGKRVDNQDKAKTYEEYFALYGNPEIKEGARVTHENGVDHMIRLGLSDKEYEALNKDLERRR